MRVPTLRGVIDRRILVNYRVEPAVLEKLLPPPFQPQLIDGMGVAGICLIRLTHLRPPLLPGIVGLASENAAHRIAVRWQEEGVWREGVYIPRRDTGSHFNTLVGGRLFPGYHHHARFQIRETADQFRVIVDSDDDDTHVAVVARLADRLPPASIFPSLEAASACGGARLLLERGAQLLERARGGTCLDEYAGRARGSSGRGGTPRTRAGDDRGYGALRAAARAVPS